jgi:hypothetical protein
LLNSMVKEMMRPHGGSCSRNPSSLLVLSNQKFFCQEKIILPSSSGSVSIDWWICKKVH